MSKYTTMVRWICEANAPDVNGEDYNEVIRVAVPKIFNFDFPMWDESYRNVLCQKILKHYYLREIGVETVGMWKLILDTRLNEIMPYYNEMYKTTVLEFNPLYNVDVTITRDVDRKENRTSGGSGSNQYENTTIDTRSGSITDHSEGDNWDKFSNTPQERLEGVRDGSYLTTARLTETENDSTRQTNDSFNGSNNGSSSNSYNESGNVNSTDNYIEKIIGKNDSGSFGEKLIKVREAIINIDKMVIDSLSDLFMRIW